MSTKLIPVKYAAQRNGLSVGWLTKLCQDGRVKGAVKIGPVWGVPSSFRWKPRRTDDRSRELAIAAPADLAELLSHFRRLSPEVQAQFVEEARARLAANRLGTKARIN